MLYYTTLYCFVSCNTVLYSTHYSIMYCLIPLILHTLQYHVLLDPSHTPHTKVSCTAWSLWYSTHYSIMYCLIPLILHTLKYHVLLDLSDTPHTKVSCTAWSLWYSTHYSIMYCLIPLIPHTLIQIENKKMIGIENKYRSILQYNHGIVLLLN